MKKILFDIGFIGGGNMAHAIIDGLVRSGHLPGRLVVADPDATQGATLSRRHAGLVVTESNEVAAVQADTLVLAVKPQIMPSVVRQLGTFPRPANQLLISIAAGIRLKNLEEWLGRSSPVVRIMPNQPALIGSGISVLVASDAVSAALKQRALDIAKAMGTAVWIDDETLMDAVTAISGSGPAYFYLLMEILENCAQEMGLSAELARALVRQTALGASELAARPDSPILELRSNVTSKGGTTHAAISALENAGIRDIFRNALRAARDRSIKLGNASATPEKAE
jgi:pyrroline-5-carboxylate reductase